jgi:hypothetical protein
MHAHNSSDCSRFICGCGIISNPRISSLPLSLSRRYNLSIRGDWLVEPIYLPEKSTITMGGSARNSQANATAPDSAGQSNAYTAMANGFFSHLFKRRFSSSSSLSLDIMEVSIPPYLARHL